MLWTEKAGNTFLKTLTLFVVCLLATFLWIGVISDTSKAQKRASFVGGGQFLGSGVGEIPDGNVGCRSPGDPLDITFDVSGIEQPVIDNVSLDITHEWVGDLNITLIAPSGESHIVFEQTNDTTDVCGDSSDLAGTYSFGDSATANFCEASGGDVVPEGFYRTSELCSDTIMNEAFVGAEPNGTWTLRIIDSGFGDRGEVNAATLSFGTADNFTSRNVDFDGDQKSDWVVLRESQNTQNSSTPQNVYDWHMFMSALSSHETRRFGDPTDTFIPKDFDGDLITDFAVWRKNDALGQAEPSFVVLESTTNTVKTEEFGLPGDNPKIVGDYDGDGLPDAATFRCPETPGQCFFFYRGTLNNPNGDITFVPWGFGDNLMPYPGDFDGDGKSDFCVRRENPNASGSAQFMILRSSDSAIEYVDWGLLTDKLVPGDFDGDGRDDFTVVRDDGTQLTWYILNRDGTPQQIPWGISTDWITPGDYDGDGKTDVAIWRPEANNSTFYTLRSSDLSLSTFRWGHSADIPLAGWQVQ